MSELLRIQPALGFAGSAALPGDKSISHRALILAALGEGRCRIENLSTGDDVRATARSLAALGVPLELDGSIAVVDGVGLRGLSPPTAPLDCGNSGTTMRLLAGVLAGAGLPGILDGDESLRRRPMRRILEPLRAMGAVIEGRTIPAGEVFAPLRFAARETPLAGRDHRLQVASAQVKTAILLAGLWAKGITRVSEPQRSRDHSERMLAAAGAELRRMADGSIAVEGSTLRMPSSLRVPGDPSSAAFLVAAALLIPGGSIELAEVDLNPTRIGWLAVLERMGADVQVLHTHEAAGDPVGRIRAGNKGALIATEIEAEEIPSLVDEIPLLAVLATQAHGQTTIRGAGELRVKESDRLATTAEGLRRLGAAIEERPDGLIVDGPTPLRGGLVRAAGDHRIAMSLAVAALIADGETTLEGAEWADVSFPGFFTLLARLCGDGPPAF